MKAVAIILSCLAVSCVWGAEENELDQVQTVYVLPMSNGFDQYLANRITSSGVFTVVTDAAKADAFFTDRLGAAFEARLNELAPVPAPKPAEPKKEQEQKSAGAAADTKATGAVPVSSLGRSRGTVFLVDVKSRRVVVDLSAAEGHGVEAVGRGGGAHREATAGGTRSQEEVGAPGRDGLRVLTRSLRR